jgi:hypothetical protein
MQAILAMLAPVIGAIKELFTFLNSVFNAFKKTAEQKTEEKESDRSKEIDKDVENAKNRSN